MSVMKLRVFDHDGFDLQDGEDSPDFPETLKLELLPRLGDFIRFEEVTLMVDRVIFLPGEEPQVELLCRRLGD